MNHLTDKIKQFLIPVAIMLPVAVCIILASRISILENRIAGREAYEELGTRESRLVQLSWYDENVYPALANGEEPAFASEYAGADRIFVDR